MTRTNLDHPHLSEGWAFPKPDGKSHYFRGGKSLCGRCVLPSSARVAGRLIDNEPTDCLTCGDIALAEVIREWCEHSMPPGECPDCVANATKPTEYEETHDA